jgi:ABC-type transport system substrate-binding protein
MARRKILLAGAGFLIVIAGVGWWLFREPLPARSPTGWEGRIGLSGSTEISSLDPADTISSQGIRVIWHLYDRLVDVDMKGEVHPMLAVSWEHSQDLRHWVFTLRKGARFHPDPRLASDQQVLTSRDVVFSIHRAINIPSYGRTLLVDLLEGAQDFIAGRTKSIRGLRTEGDDKVVFSLVAPYRFLPQRLATSFYSILPAGIPEINFAKEAVGSGPFLLDTWDRVGGVIILRKNLRYWKTLPSGAPERITFYWFASEPTMIEEFFAGNLDVIEPSVAFLRSLKDRAPRIGATLELIPDDKVKLIAINMRSGPLARRPLLRRALNLALDRQNFIDLFGGGWVLDGPIPHALFPPESSPATRADVAALLESDGYRQRPFLINLLVEEQEESRILAQAVAEQWRRVGIRVNLVLGQADFIKRVIGGEYEMALSYYGSFIPAPEPYLWLYLSQFVPVPNVMAFSDQMLDHLYDDYVGARDEETSRQILIRMCQTLWEQSPVIWLFQPPQIVVRAHGISLALAGNGIPLYTTLSRLEK